MSALPLLAPGVCQALASDLLDRGAASASGGSAEWNALWQTVRTGPGDVLAWTLVAFFLLTLGVIAGCILTMRSRPQSLTPEQLLIEEVQANEATLAESTPGREKGAAPWERDADWWRGGGH